VSSVRSAAPPPIAISAEDSGVKGKRPTTTSWSIAGSNLDAQIADGEKKNAYEPDAQAQLVAFYLTRGQTLANVADYEKAEALGAGGVKSFPKNGTTHLTHAQTLGALHLFDEEAKELDEAAKLGAPPERVTGARIGMLMAIGRYDEAQKLLGPIVEASPATAMVTVAVLRGHMQKPDEAEGLFERARTTIVDVSPFPVAWMDFQRGSLLEVAGKEKEARGYYLEALEAIPVYAHAAVHASITDPPERAIERLEALRTVSTDPDVLAALAEAHKRAKHDADAKKATEAARARYDELVAKHPEAYRDHAARFYLASGNDPKKALEYAEKNAKLRPTEEAIDLWMAAAAAVNDKAQICASALAMKGLAYASETRKRLGAAASSGCPDAGATGATDAGAGAKDAGAR
jgi:tetratricopeptide (TPR) repeat protein